MKNHVMNLLLRNFITLCKAEHKVNGMMKVPTDWTQSACPLFSATSRSAVPIDTTFKAYGKIKLL